MMKAPFIPGEAIGRAQRALSRPPARDFIERRKTLGCRVAVFALPLSLVKPQNAKTMKQKWALEKLKSSVFAVMSVQLNKRPLEPMRGRPQVHCVRFSSTPTDNGADSFKMAIDCLSPKGMKGSKVKLGFGLIRDDGPQYADVQQWWEPAPRGSGFGYIEVWTGDPNAETYEPKRKAIRPALAGASRIKTSKRSATNEERRRG